MKNKDYKKTTKKTNGTPTEFNSVDFTGLKDKKGNPIYVGQAIYIAPSRKSKKR